MLDSRRFLLHKMPPHVSLSFASLPQQQNTKQEVLVTQRNWMAMYLSRALQGRGKELGDSVHVLRRVDNFLRRNSSVDSEVRDI